MTLRRAVAWGIALLVVLTHRLAEAVDRVGAWLIDRIDDDSPRPPVDDEPATPSPAAEPAEDIGPAWWVGSPMFAERRHERDDERPS